MKSNKMLKVLSTSFILGTILMTSPSFADKAEGVSLNEKLTENTQDEQNGKECVDSNSTDKKEIITSDSTDSNEVGNVEKDSEKITEVKKEESTNNSSTDKLELSSDIEKEAVRANENIEPELILPESKFDEDMSIDDPATYDYAGYIVKHYNPTNEKFIKERNAIMVVVDDLLTDNTNGKDKKTIRQTVVTEKGKDLSSKVDEYIAELEKNKNNDKVDFEDIKTKVFGKNPEFGIDGYLNSYINCLLSIYSKSYQGDGDGHKLTIDGKLYASDFSIKSFKEIYKNNVTSVSGNGVLFTINNSFRNKPIIWVNQIFLSEKQYFQYRDEIMDFIKSEAGFKNLTSRKTRIEPYEYNKIDVNSQILPNNVKNALSKEYIESNKSSGFDIIYDTENVIRDDSSVSKKDLKESLDSDYQIDKDALNDNSFILRIGNNLKNRNLNALPINYYLSRNDKPIFKADDKLSFKQKGDIIGSEYYISNTITDKDDYIQRLTKLILESSKDDEDFNKLTKKEQDEYVQSQIQEMLSYIDYYHKDDSANIKKYQAFLNSKKWGNQRLTQYVGNVDTKTEEQDFKVIKKEDPTLAVGESKVAKKGVKGKKVTKTTYKVNRTSGELTDPVSEIVEDTKPVDEVILVGTKKVTPATPIEDIATTTKATKEVIKAEISYEADETLEFEKQNVAIKPINGEKEITTVSQSGKKDVVTEKVIKDKVDGVTKVGNKKVEVETKDGVTTTTTTIYEVEKETGKLVNPKVTTHKTTKAGIIEDIAKKTIPATKIEDIAKKTIPATKIEDIAKKTIPATKIEDIAKKTIPSTKIEDIAKKTIPSTKIEDIAKKTIPATKIEDIAKKTIPATKIENVAKKTIPSTKIEDIAKKTIPATKIEDVAKKTIPSTKIEDIAKKTIPATKIEDVAKKTIPATKIEDIAKKTMPTTKIEDIAKKTMPATKIENIAKNTNKNDEKDNSDEPKKDSHLPKAGVNSEILTLAVGALATIGGINLSKKRRK